MVFLLQRPLYTHMTGEGIVALSNQKMEKRGNCLKGELPNGGIVTVVWHTPVNSASLYLGITQMILVREVTPLTVIPDTMETGIPIILSIFGVNLLSIITLETGPMSQSRMRPLGLNG
jgi:hypothetical protein